MKIYIFYIFYIFYIIFRRLSAPEKYPVISRKSHLHNYLILSLAR